MVLQFVLDMYIPSLLGFAKSMRSGSLLEETLKFTAVICFVRVCEGGKKGMFLVIIKKKLFQRNAVQAA